MITEPLVFRCVAPKIISARALRSKKNNALALELLIETHSGLAHKEYSVHCFRTLPRSRAFVVFDDSITYGGSGGQPHMFVVVVDLVHTLFCLSHGANRHHDTWRV